MTLSARILVVAATAVAVLVVGVAAFVVLSPRMPSGPGAFGPGDSGQAGGDPEPPGPDHALPVEVPPRAESRTRPGVAGLVEPEWVRRVSAESGIPPRALAAYAGAAIVKANAMPSCGLGWSTLAAIGFVESDHARHGGARVAEDGSVSPPIFGVALDGDGSAHIPDSDGGKFDGDADFDRAVGPMQLIPQTWRNWHVDGSGDGVEDPQNLDDAVVATSNYLCRASGDMVGRAGWRAGVGAYNSSDAYVQSVADAANRYAEAVGVSTRYP